MDAPHPLPLLRCLSISRRTARCKDESCSMPTQAVSNALTLRCPFHLIVTCRPPPSSQVVSHQRRRTVQRRMCSRKTSPERFAIQVG
eukprot:9931575-Prorocentrum_lima.AAC.1